MFVLSMTPASRHQLPAIGFHQSDDFADFHVGNSQRKWGIVGLHRSTYRSPRDMRDVVALRAFALGVVADEPELVGDAAGQWDDGFKSARASSNVRVAVVSLSGSAATRPSSPA